MYTFKNLHFSPSLARHLFLIFFLDINWISIFRGNISLGMSYFVSLES